MSSISAVIELPANELPLALLEVQPPCGSPICSRISDVVLFPFRCLSALYAWLMRPITSFFLRVSVYQLMALEHSGAIVSTIFAPSLRGFVNVWSYCMGTGLSMGAFEPARLTRSETFIQQFAQFETLTTADGQKLRFALYQPEALTKWIDANGGVRDGGWVRPRTPADREKLKSLRDFHCFEEVDGSFRLPLQVDALQDKCILRCQGFGRTIPMDKYLIGLHMALGIPYAIFDWRKEALSSTGLFNDAETVYQTLLSRGFAAEQIVTMGSCRATFVMGKLLEDHYAEGLSGVLIQSPPSLKEMILKQSAIGRYLALAALPDLEDQAGDYNTIARLHRLKPSEPEQLSGKLLVILSDNDQTLPADTEAQFRALNCHAEVIVRKSENEADSHYQDPLKFPQILSQYVDFLKS